MLSGTYGGPIAPFLEPFQTKNFKFFWGKLRPPFPHLANLSEVRWGAPSRTPHRIPNVGLKKHDLSEVITRQRHNWVVAKSRRRRKFMVIHDHLRSFAFQAKSRPRRDQFLVIAVQLLAIAVTQKIFTVIHGHSRSFAFQQASRPWRDQFLVIAAQLLVIAVSKKGRH